MNKIDVIHHTIDTGLRFTRMIRNGESGTTWPALVGVYADVKDRRGLKRPLERLTDVPTAEEEALLLQPLQAALVKAIESEGYARDHGPLIAQAFIDHVPGFEEEWLQVDSVTITTIYLAWQRIIDAAKDSRYATA